MAKVMLMVLVTALVLEPVAYAVDLDTSCKLRVMLLGARGRLEKKHKSATERNDTSWDAVYNEAHHIDDAVTYLKTKLGEAGYYNYDFMFQQGITRIVYLLIHMLQCSARYGEVIYEGEIFLDKERRLKDNKRGKSEDIFTQQNEITIRISLMDAYINRGRVNEAVELGENVLDTVK